MAEHSSDDLDAWVAATIGRALAYARSLLRDPHHAEDVVQDCYCRLLAKATVYDLPRDGLKLLLTSISNAAINARTRRKNLLSLRGDRGEDVPGEVAEPADLSAFTPEKIALGNELAEAVRRGLNELPPLQRAALELKAYGHSQLEIAEILQVQANHVGVLVHRARQSLGRFLAPYLGTERPS